MLELGFSASARPMVDGVMEWSRDGPGARMRDAGTAKTSFVFAVDVGLGEKDRKTIQVSNRSVPERREPWISQRADAITVSPITPRTYTSTSLELGRGRYGGSTSAAVRVWLTLQKWARISCEKITSSR